MPELRRVRLQENFRHVAVPELVAAAIRLGIGKNGYGAEPCPESRKKGLGSPEKPDFRFSLGIGVLALPVRVKSQRPRKLPGNQRWEPIRISRLRRSNSHRGSFPGNDVVLRHACELSRWFPGT